MATLPEIPEGEAAGALRVLYDDIKATLGLPMVNLVYRHIATIPDALPWLWTVVKEGIGPQAIAATAEELPLTGFGRPLPPAVFESLGLTEADVRSAAEVVAHYNIANARNIVALAVVRRALSAAAGGQDDMPAPHPHAASGKCLPNPVRLPAMVAPDAMDARTSTIVWQLAALGKDPDAEVATAPSLWRHLAHWPGYLGFSLAALEPIAATDALATVQRRILNTADEASGRLAIPIRSRLSAAPAGSQEQLERALEHFSDLIPYMLPIGYTLIRLTPEAWRPRTASRPTQ